MSTPTALDPSTPVAILCGGRGLRLGAHDAPKPLVPIGGRPVLGHVIDIYARQGARQFVLLGGHRVDEIRAWVAAERWPDDVVIEVLDTGDDTPTGGRVHAAADRLTAGPAGRFHLTYADGVADIDLAATLARHHETGAALTVTVVRPELNFGVAEIDAAGMISGFREKPIAEFAVNGGFMVASPQLLDVLGPMSVLEQEPMQQLAAAGQIAAQPHAGFWACMDTPKDLAVLEAQWEIGAPWLLAGPGVDPGHTASDDASDEPLAAR